MTKFTIVVPIILKLSLTVISRSLFYIFAQKLAHKSLCSIFSAAYGNGCCVCIVNGLLCTCEKYCVMVVVWLCACNNVELVADVATSCQNYRRCQMVRCLLLEANRLRYACCVYVMCGMSLPFFAVRCGLWISAKKCIYCQNTTLS